MATCNCPLSYETQGYRHAPSCPVCREWHAVRFERRAAGLCPTCGRVKLSRLERARGYQCRECADLEEGV